ncbi:uncharacterized protein ATNIH1004_005198 [Aspergillus tanneri]|uniref:Uncharacterized protein n=1 Tax=Aspergillus tanneri TaxID=1220188 RepID=A0A5M9N3Z7_9EURO|nr:uncharacterized protein ATNIH1004_005198 [Aspergillus tanneri]KAA8649297.1 hypothetical protein ATNIH1004_005198 [Aspergillus tanneri]
MAHQADALPWKDFASIFDFAYRSKRHHGETNLFARQRTSVQVRQLYSFVSAFVRILEEHTDKEMSMYVDVEQDDEVISESTARNIQHLVQPTNPVFSVEGRKISFWTDRVGTANSREDKTGTFTALLLQDEMDALFSIRAEPPIQLCLKRGRCSHSCTKFGLPELVDTAMMAYICLNMLFQKTELHDAETRANYIQSGKSGDSLIMDENVLDYRSTRGYQKMLFECTQSKTICGAVIHTIPHRQFYGYQDCSYTTEEEFGFLTLPALISRFTRGIYQPDSHDVAIVIYILQQMGLPTELILIILELAEYAPKGSIPIPHDPLHKKNLPELQKYLDYCWQLLVRTNMLVKYRDNDWEGRVLECIWKLFGVEHPRHFLRSRANRP